MTRATVRFEDGSAVRFDAPTSALDAQPGAASLALACAVHAAERPAVEALAWFRGRSPSGRLAAAPAAGGRLDLRVGEEHGTVRLADFRALLALVYAARLGDESFWLFRPDPIACLPSPGDRSFGEALEPRLRAFDEAVRGGQLDQVREGARRKVLFAEVGAAGLLDEPLLDRKVEVLEQLGLSHLGSLGSAARRLADYYASSERARYVRRPRPANAHSGALSLDWARSVTRPPDGWTLFEWWAACEDSFLGFPEPTVPRGHTFLHQGSLRAVLAWRCEDGSRTALYDVTVSQPSSPR